MINDIIQTWGIANPQISVGWTINGLTTPATTVSFDNQFQLSCTIPDRWVTPVAGILLKNDAANVKGIEKIVMPDGSTPTNGLVLRIFPQVYAALTRLYSGLLEGLPLATAHRPERPIPYYFVYTDVSDINNAPQGYIKAGINILNTGKMTIHDINGLPIDPTAVAAAFDIFVQRFASMEDKLLTSSPASPTPPISANRQLTTIANLAGATPSTRLHLVTPFGKPFTTTTLPFNNITVANAPTGLYTINTPATAIAKINATTPNIKIGAGTFGLLNDTYTIRPLLNTVTLRRDFLRAIVVDLTPHLIGNAPATEPTVINAQLPVVRDNEQITFSFSGNQCLGSVNGMMSGAPSVSLLVSPVIDADFNLPPTTNNEWPSFPAVLGDGINTAAIPNIQQVDVTMVAHFIQDAVTQNADVFLSMTSAKFANGDAIRVYTRLFHPDGRETRGDGAGTVINGTTAVVRLRDPFNLIRPFTTVVIPTNPDLMCDFAVINRNIVPQKRSLGLMTAVVAAPSVLTASEIASLGTSTNTLNAVAERGISPSGILGFAPINGAPTTLTSLNDFLRLFGEAQPRRAPRYPTMSRSDSMAVAKQGVNWTAQLSGLVIKKDALQNFSSLANPGSPGGTELHTIGVTTQNGLLAYDVARAAYRRTRNVAERMFNLIQNNNWNPPAAPAAGSGTFAAATLQTIAKGCETPELSLFPQGYTTLKQNTPAQVAQQLSNFVTNNVIPSWMPPAATTAFTNAMVGLGNNPNVQSAYGELSREYDASLNGRRDAFWALKNALDNARECIYIQGTFFGDTHYPTLPARLADDFIEIIKAKLTQNKALKVILCLSQKIHYGKGYETFMAREYKKRQEAIQYLGNPDRVIAFHPMGHPQRPKQLMTNIVLVDDVWAMVGTSNLRRRGLMFDGGQDIVLLDRTIVNGKSAGIAAFRRQVMADHLSLQNQNSTLPIPHATQVRLNDIHESFFVFKELLSQGGAGLIRPIWAGDLTDITPSSFPSDDMADPNSDTFDNLNALLMTGLQGMASNAGL
jgi:hypothetical protein